MLVLIIGSWYSLCQKTNRQRLSFVTYFAIFKILIVLSQVNAKFEVVYSIIGSENF